MSNKIAVVIPTFYRSELLLRALRSVDLAASAVHEPIDVEAIVVDDAHDDQTLDTVSSNAGKLAINVKYLRHSKGKHLGPAASRNHGVLSTNAEFIYFLDDDDEFTENRFQNSLSLFANNEADAVFERCLRLYRNQDSQATGPYESQYKNPFYFLLLGGFESWVLTSAFSVRRAKYLELGGMDERLIYAEDGEFMLRLSMNSSNARVAMLTGDPIVIKHEHDSNMTAVEKVRHWHAIKAFSILYDKMDDVKDREQKLFMKRFISSKLDYVLHRCRIDYVYARRLSEGMKALSSVPFDCFCAHNLKSILVWLLKKA